MHTESCIFPVCIDNIWSYFLWTPVIVGSSRFSLLTIFKVRLYYSGLGEILRSVGLQTWETQTVPIVTPKRVEFTLFLRLHREISTGTKKAICRNWCPELQQCKGFITARPQGDQSVPLGAGYLSTIDRTKRFLFFICRALYIKKYIKN